jgi:hypothetical protein
MPDLVQEILETITAWEAQKLRVFCHPDCYEAISQAAERYPLMEVTATRLVPRGKVYVANDAGLLRSKEA